MSTENGSAPVPTPQPAAGPRSPLAGTAGRFLVVASVLVLGAAIAFLTTRDGSQPSAKPNPSTPATLTMNCFKDEPPISLPSWYPADLPLPDGTYAIQIPPASNGLRRIVFSAKGTLRDFVVYALGEWPKKGWTLGHGESELGEAEDNFLMGERYGIFRAQSIMCDQGRTWVLIVLNDPSVKNAPTPGFNTFNPSASPTPLKP